MAGGRVAVPDVPSPLSVEPAMSRSSLRPLQRLVADCSAWCTCLASQLMYAADAYPQANPALAQGLPWHALLHTSSLAFHILTAGTLVTCSRAWPGHQRSVLNPLAPFSFVPPIAVGARFYRARCLGVALYLSYSLRFVTLSPLEAGGSLAVLEGRASPPHLNAGLRLTLRPIPLRYGFACDVQYYTCSFAILAITVSLIPG